MELDLLIRTFHAAKPEPSRARGGEEEPALLGPNFLAAFPEAPATSSAARIPAEGELGTPGNTKTRMLQRDISSAHTFTLHASAERREQPRKPGRSICQCTWLGECAWTEFIAADTLDR